MTRLSVRRLLTAATMLVLVAACGDDTDRASSLEVSSTIPVATIAPATTAVETTLPTTTAVATSAPPPATPSTPSTTASITPSTVAPPQTSLPDDEQWSPVDFTPSVFGVGYSGNYEGLASPSAPSGAEVPLADGYYSARLLEPWTTADPGQLRIEVGGFAPCRDLGDVCYENPDDPNELGIDPSWSRLIDVPLDDSTDVIVSGFRCLGDEELEHADGAALEELFTAYDADYSAGIAPLLAAGMDASEIERAVAENPVGGFIAESQVCQESEGMAGPLRYIHEDAPALLLQALSTYNPDGANLPLEATDLVGLQGVDVRSGVMTWYFYAGFYS